MDEEKNVVRIAQREREKSMATFVIILTQLCLISMYNWSLAEQSRDEIFEIQAITCSVHIRNEACIELVVN